MTRALLCPIGSRGFVYPMLGLGREMRQRGAQVAFATSLDFAADLESRGFERIPRGSDDGPSFQLANWGHPLAVAIQARHLLHAIERWAPDMIVASPLALGGLLAGEVAGLPVAVLGLASYLWPVPGPDGHLLAPDDQAAWRHAEMLESYNQARGLFRLPPWRGPLPESPLLGSLYLLQSVPELEPLAAALPGRVRLVGSCVHEPDPPDPELAAWLSRARGRPLAYVQHGSIFREQADFWPALCTAAETEGIRLAASLERRRRAGQQDASGHLFARGHTPQEQVLRQAQAVVASGNTTAVLGALGHGLPLLLLPGGGEQRALAARCVGAGAALAIDPGASADEVGRALRRLVEDAGLREAARELQSAFARFDGPALAAGALMELARSSAVGAA
jgi:UDP:flavonoid glycosyltransferase YjiC (YdhE family)